MKKMLVSLAVVTALLSLGVAYGGDSPAGKPFQYLQEQIDALLTRVGLLEGRADTSEAAIAALRREAARCGTKVAPGLYDVHTKVLWDIGWLSDTYSAEPDEFTYNEHPRRLLYGADRDLFLGPLTAYGIPPVQEGATRKVRLYVTYGHQWMCNGTPTVQIGDVEFHLPVISGHYAAMGANWSNFREWDEYSHLGHANILVYLKDFSYGGPHCGPYPGTDRPKGVIHRIEAHFYDEFAD